MPLTPRPTRGLIFDPFAGISGDMTVGALVDVGLEPAWLEAFVASLGLGAGVQMERVDRAGISCARVVFDLPEERAHRHLSDVLEIVDGCGAPQPVRSRAGDAFRSLAEAEAEVHGSTLEGVHFHEVGALDAILDVLCTFAGIAELGVEACFTRPIGVGSGSIEIEHGRYPLPAPATAKLLAGMPVRDTGYTEECTTPTGAAILRTLTAGRRPPHELVLGRTGFGAGSRAYPDRPNCLRVWVCDVPARSDEALYIVQADIDDLPAEYVPAARLALMDAGAVDVTVSGLGMKKGRPGVRIEALAPAPMLDAVIGALFTNTSTIGVRYWPVDRAVLDRSEEVVEWRGQSIRVKRVRLPDGQQRSKPEYEDVARAAQALGLAPYEIRLALDSDLNG